MQPAHATTVFPCLEIGGYWPNRRKFYDPVEFEFLNALRDNWQAIRTVRLRCAPARMRDCVGAFLSLQLLLRPQEYDEVAKSRVHPWPETTLFRTYHNDEEATVSEGAGWNVFGLYAFNKKRSENCALCPVTTRLIEQFPYQGVCGGGSVCVQLLRMKLDGCCYCFN